MHFIALKRFINTFFVRQLWPDCGAAVALDWL
mgnify:CR=1 FL=1